jgi:hypothetical protein
MTITGRLARDLERRGLDEGRVALSVAAMQ